jgi:hypothetical protein
MEENIPAHFGMPAARLQAVNDCYHRQRTLRPESNPGPKGEPDAARLRSCWVNAPRSLVCLGQRENRSAHAKHNGPP